jgi:hypothetical protein
VHVCQVLGYHAILAGVPMTPEAGHVVRKQVWKDCRLYVRGWVVAEASIKPMVRSMSGWTRSTFGAPTEKWLKENQNG